MTLSELKAAIIDILRERKSKDPQHRSKPICVEAFICAEITEEMMHSAVDELVKADFICLADGGPGIPNRLAFSSIYLK